MAQITTQLVKELRQLTGAGVLDCKEALERHEGDMERAVAYLREKGKLAAAKRASRATGEGLIGAYVHAGSKVAALVEINCETDFVARTEEFQALAHDLAMQVVAGKPLYLSPDDVPEAALEEERQKYPSGEWDDKRLQRFYEEICLLEQPFIKDTSITVRELVQQKNALLGENVVVRRFVRFEVGG